MKIKNLDAFRIDKNSRTELPMPELGKDAVLELAPAFDANEDYHNALLKLTAGIRRKDLTAMDRDMLDELRDIQRELYWRYIIKGWRGMEGEPEDPDTGEDGLVPFDRKFARDLCKQLPDQLFDRMTLRASSSRAFYPTDSDEGPEITTEDLLAELDDLAGN